MTLLFAFFMLATATLVGWAEAGKAPKKYPISLPLERNNASNPWLTQGCKQWEGNCDHKYNKTGTCKNDSVICKQGYYRGNPTFDDEPGKDPILYGGRAKELYCNRKHNTGEQCKDGEVYVHNAKCPEWTCEMVNGHRKERSAGGDDSPCEQGDITLDPGCYCAPDYARKNGVCIPIKMCRDPPPPCHGNNTQFEPCPMRVDVNCADIVSFDPAMPPLRTSGGGQYCLEAGCRCLEGYARNDEGNCARIVGSGVDACEEL
ncbi:hypothetical protein Ddc_17367 [Ditylenchus destructor]|nr:hypothetical protein Ddc_17367 [Ditylenchus destructor]